MTPSIDDTLDNAFTPNHVKEVFAGYLESKWDKFSPKDRPVINVPIGADGVTYKAFANQLDRHASNICRRVHEGSYIFYPFREVEVIKEPASSDAPPKYRTLSIASIRDVIVQNILYHNVLYRPVEKLFRELDAPNVVSFAYRKRKSAPQAAALIHGYIKSGYMYVFETDLKKYFDTIPHTALMNKVAAIIDDTDSRTFELLDRFIHTDRVPYHTYRNARRRGKLVGHKIFHWRKPLRKRRESGVPQGGVLSGMLANLFLHEFDDWVVHVLGDNRDIRYVRYADDFIILAKDPAFLVGLQEHITEKLRSETLVLSLNESKTNTIDVRDHAGMDFVGFHFDEEHVRVRKRNIRRYKDRLFEIIWPSPATDKELPPKSEARLQYLACRIMYKVQGLSRVRECYRCGYPRIAPPRSWMAFFSCVTDVSQIRELDRWTRQQLSEHIFHQYRIRLSRRYLRQIGLKSLINEYYQIRNLRLQPCICDLENAGIWHYARDLYENREFPTLAGQRSFRVLSVSDSGLKLRTKAGTINTISKDVMLAQWKNLYNGESISRLKLESDGIRSASHVTALLAVLPGVEYSLWPIKLTFNRPRKWTGLDLLT